MGRILTFLLVTVLWLGPANAQEIGGEASAPTAARDLDEVLLKDGNVLRGKLILEQTDLIVFETESLGRLEIPRVNIDRIALGGASEGVVTDPDQNTIMFCPTPATLPKGEAYFRDFELFVLNFGFGLSDAFDLSVGTLFPVTGDALMISVGGKLRLVDRDKAPLGLALTGSYTVLEETQFGAIGGVIGIGNRRNSLNLSVNYTFDDDGDHDTVFLVGGDVLIGRRSKLFAEYFNSSALLSDEDDDLHGFINIGFRLFGERHSFSLSGFRPLLDDSDSFIAFPMIMYSYHF